MPLTDHAAKNVVKMLAVFEASGDVAIGETKVDNVMKRMFGVSNFDVTDGLEVIGDMHEYNNFTNWIALAGNTPGHLKGYYFEAWDVRQRFAPGDVAILADSQKMDVIAHGADLYEYKNHEGVPDLERLKEQAERHGENYVDVFGAGRKYYYVFSRVYSDSDRIAIENAVRQGIALGDATFGGDVIFLYRNGNHSIPPSMQGNVSYED
ncbi:MAG: hypothetical protein RLY93_03555 [Sumerlaeia bacterium]